MKGGRAAREFDEVLAGGPEFNWPISFSAAFVQRRTSIKFFLDSRIYRFFSLRASVCALCCED